MFGTANKVLLYLPQKLIVYCHGNLKNLKQCITFSLRYLQLTFCCCDKIVLMYLKQKCQGNKALLSSVTWQLSYTALHSLRTGDATHRLRKPIKLMPFSKTLFVAIISGPNRFTKNQLRANEFKVEARVVGW